MSTKDRFKERYETGNTPWDVGRPDFNLIDMVTKWPIPHCKALDIGCGSGTDSIWLAKQGFSVTGIDVSAIALEKAQQKASDAGVQCEFLEADFPELKRKITGAPFGFVFDRGCFHSFDTGEEREKFAKNVAGHLKEDGIWLSLVGSADDRPRDTGPPRRTARDIILAVEPFFEILSIHTSHFETRHPKPSRAWVCLMRKRI